MIFTSVPEATPPSLCRDCKRPVYAVTRIGGDEAHTRRIDCDAPGAKRPTKTSPGYGVLHRTVCKGKAA